MRAMTLTPMWPAAVALAVCLTACVRYEPAAAPTTAPAPAAGTPSTAAPDAMPADGFSAAVPMDAWAGAFNNAYRLDDDYFFAGLPTEAGLRLAADDGVKVVVNLLTESQQAERIAFDEPALVAELGQKYVTIPIMPDTFSKEDVARFANAVENVDAPVLVHCASANRVGALWAAYLNLHRGVELERAIELGRSAGLSGDSMVEAVRRVTSED